jgi:hypothetical protein
MVGVSVGKPTVSYKLTVTEEDIMVSLGKATLISNDKIGTTPCFGLKDQDSEFQSQNLQK